MLGIPRPFLHRALCGALLVTSIACDGGNVVFDEPKDSGTDPASALDSGDPGGNGNGNGNGSNGDNNSGGTSSGTNGPPVVVPEPVDSGIKDAGMDAGPTKHPLAGQYAVRTVIYARQKADLGDQTIDVISEGTLLSVLDVSDTGLSTEHYCFIETANVDGITSWTQPAATENIPNSVVQLTREQDNFVRGQTGDLTYVSWSPLKQPADCVIGQTHSTDCLCGDPDTLPIEGKDCRVLDLDNDGAPGGTLFVGLGRPTDPSDGNNLVRLSIVGEKAIEWRIPAGQAGTSIKGAITGGIDQSEVGRRRGSKPEQGDDTVLNAFSRIRNSICPGNYGHVELVRGTFSCASLLAARTETDLDSYGVFDTKLDSNLGSQKFDADGGLIPVDTSVCPDPDACATGVKKDECGVCGGDGSPGDTCDCDGTPKTTWYDDTDKDGLGDPAVSQQACAEPTGYVENSDDRDITCGPQATTWYDDTDGDGFGNLAITRAACVKPTGYVANSTDQCPNDRPKQAPGVCGCAIADANGDGDTLLNCRDNCPTITNQDQADFNTDGQGDVCDDTDGDSFPDSTDNCRSVSNNPQTNTDGAADGGDACDTDDDNDTILDSNDNCSLVANANQLNTDGATDGGNACDTDDDNDTVADTNDNCPVDANPNQQNSDNAQDGGNACDSDDDNDTVADAADNCPVNANTTQLNTDGQTDGGDVCDLDDDNDGTPDTTDQCPVHAIKVAPGACGCTVADVNTDGDAQFDCNETCDTDPNKTAPGICNCGLADIDRNGDGSVTAADCTDACPTDPNKFVPGICGCGVADTNTDGDSLVDCREDCDTDPLKTVAGACGCGVADTNSDADPLPNCRDNCPTVTNPDQADFNSNSKGDACDDSDGDSFPDSTDNCRTVANNPQTNSDGDANGGDACDPDDDNDGRADTSDNCPLVANPNQENNDTDAAGNACDTDDDNDTRLDTNDNCPVNANTDQLNTDRQPDGGDACDTDDDNDTRLDTNDNCPVNANTDQLNTDLQPDGGNACDLDDDNDGTPDTSDQCPVNAPKTQPGLCGCAVAEGTCATEDLSGVYAVRSMIYNKSKDSATDRSIDTGVSANYSIITINAKGDGSYVLFDRGCYVRGTVGGNNSWSPSSWAQGLPIYERPVASLGGGRYRRMEVLEHVGWDPNKACTSGCRCNTSAIPPYYSGNTASQQDCRLVDSDGEGSPGVSAIASTSTPFSTNDTALSGQDVGFRAEVMAIAEARNTWTITYAANKRHTGTVADTGTISRIVGCTGSACLGLTGQPISQTCPERFNVVQFVPIAELNTNGGTFDCTELLTQSANFATIFGAEPTAPPTGTGATQCPAP